MDTATLRDAVAGTPWYHSIDLGQGVVTPGAVPLDAIPDSLLPDLSHRSVLDIGAWDGANSFRAERLGARRVVALDHYAWGVDIAGRQAYWDACASNSLLPDHSLDQTQFWRPELPGKRSFDLAHGALESNVEAVVGDYMAMDASTLGTFDVVLYLGVLYHMKEPLTALERVRALTREVAVIETEAVHVRGHAGASLAEFLPGNELRRDFGNWYLPTEGALHALCLAAGFGRVKTIRGTTSRRARWTKPSHNYRLLVHAYR